MNDLIRKRDIDYISAPIAPVLKGEKVHYEYVAFRKQIEDISPVPAIPISVIEDIKREFSPLYGYGATEIWKIIDEHIDEYIKEYTDGGEIF